MRLKLLLLAVMLFAASGAAFPQHLMPRWDSAFAEGKIIITPVAELNSTDGDYAPVLLNSGKLIF